MATKRSLEPDEVVYYWCTEESKVKKTRIMKRVSPGQEGEEEEYMVLCGKKLRRSDLHSSRQDLRGLAYQDLAPVSVALSHPDQHSAEGVAPVVVMTLA